jgi:phospholipid transport system substrate-binding protein
MRAILILALAAFTVLPSGSALAFAEPQPGDNPSPAASANTPEEVQKVPAGKFVQDLGNRAIAQITNKNLSPEARQEKYRDILRDSFDMQTIGHFVIGRAYNAASPEQQQEYMKLFEQVVLKTYGDRLNLYSGEEFHVKNVRPESEKDSIVGSEITHADNSEPTKVDWRVRQQNGKLAVIDVVVEGVSQSVTQRDEYMSIVQRDGGRLDGLLDLMRKQVQDQQQSQ